MRKHAILLTALTCTIFLSGCVIKYAMQEHKSLKLKRIKYTVQVGAFSKMDNAVKLSHKLKNGGLDSYYFKHSDGLFKVRFGNYQSYSSDKRNAEKLKRRRFLGNYLVVSHENISKNKKNQNGYRNLRAKIVATAKRFLGILYKWGGSSAKGGFDCSGLAMTVYRLNGLMLPRVASSQKKAGKFVLKRNLMPGDLVFFATSGGRRVSHVGIYIGHGKFIHSPGRGKRVKIARLKNVYFKKRYLGASKFI